MKCPSADDEMPVIAALLPRGHAWAAIDRQGSVLWRWFRAAADDLAHLEARICAARAELFCRTAVETRDWWLIDYGLPDACDPWADPCSKRLAVGASRCEHWAAHAALAGWSITCDLTAACGGTADDARADCAATAMDWPGPVLIITVDAAASTAWVAPQTVEAIADCYRADEPVGCGPDLSTLECLLERLIPDHIARQYEVINDG